MSDQYCDVKAGLLSEALKNTNYKRRKKPLYVDLEFYRGSSQLSVSESKFSKFDHLIEAIGKETWRCQVDGVKLAKIVTTWPLDTVIRLTYMAVGLQVSNGKSKVMVPSTGLNGVKPIKREVLKPDPNHKGMPEGIDEPLRHKTDQRQTWLFSARIPMPEDK
ncbi:hypothetical protein MTBPR1_140050 [Candidatus Terasakiella magnetica]|uniref:Uncharacterized protein n=1 Tax=Candidatus Terasakiella magnetica TaxID=1867952 RepID=A0A1C3RFD0_9PROT|nr:hypothetical protein [Candidatus Terasakiella magnetica]SCA55932.1 hypothetical protein MTBPR1_140050 [Candidatus Terasakiella magnetica]